MNKVRSLRTAAVAVAAAALLAPALVALAGPANAGSVKRHDVNIYKVEGFVELGGEYPDNEAHEHLFCEPGDVVVDGMWKVDSYETPNADDDVYGDTRDVIATESWPDQADETKWHYYFVNNGTGRATLKTFVTCMTPETGERNGHTHDISIDDQTPVLAHPITGGTPYTFATQCDAGEYAVSPGFRVQNGDARLVASKPSGDARNWIWTFESGAGADIDFYLKCLTKTLSVETGDGDSLPHVHDLDLDWTPSTTLETFTLGGSSREIATQKATPKDFALVGGFDTAVPADTYYLGQDARGRKRDFVFWCDDVSCDVDLGVLSLGKRTSRQLQP